MGGGGRRCLRGDPEGEAGEGTAVGCAKVDREGQGACRGKECIMVCVWQTVVAVTVLRTAAVVAVVDPSSACDAPAVFTRPSP
jgi:hypothetical protein